MKLNAARHLLSKIIRHRLFIPAFLIFAFLILFLRRPDAIIHAQFWAEDGAYWYANVNDVGPWKPFLWPAAGYFQTLARVASATASYAPLAHAPVVMNIVAMGVMILPAGFTLSSRFGRLVPDNTVRLLLATLYLVLPNTAEMHANITNAQWHLALLAFMVLIAETSRVRRWRAFDLSVLILSGLSGPFCLFLLPVAIAQYVRTRDHWRLTLTAALTGTSLIQLASLIFIPISLRAPGLPAVSADMFFAITSKQVFLGSVLGANGFLSVEQTFHNSAAIIVLTSILGFALVGYALWKAKIELKIFILFAGALFVAGLASPTIGDLNFKPEFHEQAWHALFASNDGSRYWLFPMLAFVTSLVWSLKKSNPKIIRATAAAFIILLGIGVASDYRHKPYEDVLFPKYAARFESMNKGEYISIPLNPEGWRMELTKH